MNRPLLSKTAAEIAKAVEINCRNRAELQLILAELVHRKTPNARKIADRAHGYLTLLDVQRNDGKEGSPSMATAPPPAIGPRRAARTSPGLRELAINGTYADEQNESSPTSPQIHGKEVQTASGKVQIRNLSNGQVVGFLQEAAPLAPLLLNPVTAMPAAFGILGKAVMAVNQHAPTEGLIAAAGSGHVEGGLNTKGPSLKGMELGLQSLNQLGIANLAVSAVGIGISVAGFAIMAARIEAVKQAVLGLADGTRHRPQDPCPRGCDRDP